MVVLKENHLNKLVTLIEDNPLVKSFSDVETILTHLCGLGGVSLLFSETGSPKSDTLDLGINTSEEDLLAKTYKIEFESVTLCICVVHIVYNSVNKFLVSLMSK